MLRKRIFVLSLPLILTAFLSTGQERHIKQTFDIKKSAIMLPKEYAFKEFNWMFGFSFAKVPFDWVETSLQAPLFYLHANYGLPYNIVLNAEWQTLIVSNQFRLGAKWTHEIGNFSFGVGYDQNFMFGKMGFLGFDNRFKGWTSIPNVSVGLKIGNVALSAVGEFPAITSLKRTAGEIDTYSSKNVFIGPSVNFYVEQRLYKHHILVVGLKNSYTKFFFPAWMAFSTFNRRYYVPELFLGFKL